MQSAFDTTSLADDAKHCSITGVVASQGFAAMCRLMKDLQVAGSSEHI